MVAIAPSCSNEHPRPMPSENRFPTAARPWMSPLLNKKKHIHPPALLSLMQYLFPSHVTQPKPLPLAFLS